jgi:hypothetical protein
MRLRSKGGDLVIRYYSAKHNRFINFEATGKLDEWNCPVLKGFDCMGTEYEASGIENTNRTLVAATDIKIKEGDK